MANVNATYLVVYDIDAGAEDHIIDDSDVRIDKLQRKGLEAQRIDLDRHDVEGLWEHAA